MCVVVDSIKMLVVIDSILSQGTGLVKGFELENSWQHCDTAW